MANELVDVLAELADRVVSLAAEDAQLRDQLRRLAAAILQATELPQTEPAPAAAGDQAAELAAAPSEAGGPSTSPAAVAGSPATLIPHPSSLIPHPSSLIPHPSSLIPQSPSPAPAADSPATAEPTVLPELTLGRSVSPEQPEPAFPARWRTTADEDLPLVEERCRLKAEGARWAAARPRLLAAGADFATQIAPTDREIISRAKNIPDCFLWMCHRDAPLPADCSLYEDVGGCFDSVAAVLAVIRQIQDDPESQQAEFERALDLLAESQSALRMAIAAVDGSTDTDQVQVFTWLKATASERQIYIQRHMRMDDPAEPTAWKDLAGRIAALDAHLQEGQRRARHRRKLLGKVRHRVSLIAENPQAADAQWEILAAVVEELVSREGLPPSNRELRELLMPVVDYLPDLPELPAGFQLVLRELDRYLANCQEPEEVASPQPAPQVQEVARLLNERSLILIGGDRRPASHRAIEDAFCLRELLWIETREHESIDSFEPYIARPDVAAVLLAIRWSSHSFADVKEFCERHGKPLVRLPAGYNPNQVAAQILAQCSERLRASETPPG